MLTHEESVPFTVFSGAAEPLDQAAGLVLSELQQAETGGGSGGGSGSVRAGQLVRVMRDHRRVHGIIKALVTVGSQLVTVGEYRDYFEDLLTKVLYACCMHAVRMLAHLS